MCWRSVLDEYLLHSKMDWYELQRRSNSARLLRGRRDVTRTAGTARSLLGEARYVTVKLSAVDGNLARPLIDRVGRRSHGDHLGPRRKSMIISTAEL